MLPDLFFFGGFTAAPDGTVWLSDLYVLGRYADEAWTLYRSPNSLEAYGTYFMENTIQQYDAPVLVTEEALPLDRVTDLATDSNGILWVATSEGVLRFDGQNWIIYRDELISTSILALTIAPDNSVWVGGQRGLSHFDGRQWTNYPQAKGLLSIYLDMLAVDAGGNVWGTTNSDVFRFDGERWDIPSELEELNVGIVWSLAAGPDGTIWVGSENGLSHFDGSHWSHYPLDKMLLSASGGVNAEGIMALAVALDGTVWCGTQRGVASFRISDTDFTEANRDRREPITLENVDQIELFSILRS